MADRYSISTLRLPRNVVPNHYSLKIKIDLVKCNFNGSAEVDVTVNESTSSVLLNSLGLAVSEGEFQCGSNTICVKETQELKADERIEFIFGRPIHKGTGILRYSFSAGLSEDQRGLYRCEAWDEKNRRMNFAATSFESADARRAFPCWDEPALKATFQVTMITQRPYLVLSNMPIIEQKKYSEEGWLMTLFECTPKMSTYLLSFVVGRFNYIEAFSARRVRIRVYAMVDKENQGEYALQTAVKSLDFFENYFDIPYPLAKVDLVALPETSAGSMENWGLITFRETSILFDQIDSSTMRMQGIALVISHEMAHQWIGNLVTMEWWTYLWLNEGFAQFMESLCVSKFAPEFDVLTQFTANTVSKALEDDALDNSHPIEVEVECPAEVDEIFDAISYKKGASVIWMLYNYIGDEKFRTGLSTYLLQHAYGNTSSEDLWLTLSEVSGLRVGDMMNSWVKQKGFPLLFVKCRKLGANCVLEIKQEKFHSLAEKAKYAKQALWKIPIVIGVPGMKNTVVLMEKPKEDILIKGASKAAWIHVNHGAAGVFRIHYDEPMRKALLLAIRNKSLSPMNRFILHSDLLALVEAGYASMKELLELTEVYSSETDYSVWTSVSTLMTKLEILLGHRPELVERLHGFGRKLYSEVFKGLGWDSKPDEKPARAMLRALVLGKMVKFGEEQVLNEAQRRFVAHVSGRNELIADLRMPVYRAVAQMAHNHPETWDQLMSLHRKAKVQEEANRVAIALGSVQTRPLLIKVLEFAASNAVRYHDSVLVMESVTHSAMGQELAWEHFTALFETYNRRYNSGSRFLRLIRASAKNFCTFEKAKEVKEFFQKNPVVGAESTMRQVIEVIEANAAWLKRDERHIFEFFRER